MIGVCLLLLAISNAINICDNMKLKKRLFYFEHDTLSCYRRILHEIFIIRNKNSDLKFKEILENIKKHTYCDNGWECKVYKGHHCRYSNEDVNADNCIFCGEPSERK